MAGTRWRREIVCSATISAACDEVLNAFFDDQALRQWWHVRRSVCVARSLGCYAVEWEATERRDELLGRLGGVLHGTVMTFDPQREFFVAEAFWMPPDGEPLGPMALEVTCTPGPGGTTVRVRHSSADTSERWDRYYEAMHMGLTVSLERLAAMFDGGKTNSPQPAP